MSFSLSGRRPVTLILWLLCAIAIPIWVHYDVPAWDVSIYLQAVHSLKAGHDPYADAIAIQGLYHQQLLLHTLPPNAPTPFSYVYSPITLPVLRLVGVLPLLLSGLVYWTLYLAGMLAQVWVGMQAVQPGERRYFRWLAPVAVFFPGFLGSDILLSGNIAYILYGLVLVAAVIGWRRNTWRWFYLAILAASCFKAPLLSLVVIPILSARKQWLPTAATAVAGLTLFAMQPLLWPTLFHHYLQSVELQFSYNHDFGCSPAGLFSEFLVNHNHTYSPGSYIFYLCYAIPLFALLVFLSRQFLRGCFSLKQWIPVLLVGVILLNPRLIEYDVAPLALPLALIAWRFFAERKRGRNSELRLVLSFTLLFLALNVLATQSWDIWKRVDGVLLVVFFSAGAYGLLEHCRAFTHDPRRRITREREFLPDEAAIPALQFQATKGT
jgi:hypothetical protein